MPEDKKSDDFAQVLKSNRWHGQTMCQEKKKEEDLPAFRMALMHSYKDSNTMLKGTKTIICSC